MWKVSRGSKNLSRMVTRGGGKAVLGVKPDPSNGTWMEFDGR